MRPIGSAIGRSGISPDAVTTVGVVLQVVAAVFILQGRLFVAASVTALAAIADVLDGAIAKAQNRDSRWGALFDSTTDRLADALLFLPLAWLYGMSPDVPDREARWVAAIALVTLVASFLVSYVKARAESLGFDCNVGIVERAERLIIVIVGLAFDIVPVMLIVLGGLSVVTFVQRLFHVRRQEKRGS
jgi:CDP-diacylglycerol--glycerol-3-phosphate 3-phosphatidyltransferase